MKQLPFQQATFLASSFGEHIHPPVRDSRGHFLPEIALVGRSNVGKSSLLNFLLCSKDLARVSTVPGKTQTLNFFVIDDRAILVDLPGYGFAQVAKSMQHAWSESIDVYLQTREQLALVLLLIDIRRTLTESDRRMATWCAYHRKPLIPVFTKSDKEGRVAVKKAILEDAFTVLKKIEGLQCAVPVMVSIKDRSSRKLLIETINSFDVSN